MRTIARLPSNCQVVLRVAWPEEGGAPVGSSFDRSWLHDQDLFHEDLFVGGRWRSGGTGRRIDVTDPATGAVIGQIAEADETDVRDAITAAQEAFPVWAALTAQQ